MIDISFNIQILFDLYLTDNVGSVHEDFLQFCRRYSKAKITYRENDPSSVVLSFEKQSDLTMFLLKLPDEYQ